MESSSFPTVIQPPEIGKLVLFFVLSIISGIAGLIMLVISYFAYGQNLSLVGSFLIWGLCSTGVAVVMIFIGTMLAYIWGPLSLVVPIGYYYIFSNYVEPWVLAQTGLYHTMFLDVVFWINVVLAVISAFVCWKTARDFKGI
jgi:hypothetical protein